MMHPHAYHAIRAANNWRSWGRFAAVRYCQRRGVPTRLFYLARQLAAIKGV